MIHDLGDPSNSDAENNKNNINLAPKCSPVPAKRDLCGKRSFETTSPTSNHQQANDLSPKMQSKNRLDSLLTRIEVPKERLRSKETNLVNAEKSDSRDYQFKSILTEGLPMTEKVVEKSEEATSSNSVKSNTIGSKLDNNSCCDIESNNDPASNNKIVGSSAANRDSITGTPELNKSKAKVQPAAQQLPQTNLIRREDSWQSLVSLTRVGKLGSASMQGK